MYGLLVVRFMRWFGARLTGMLGVFLMGMGMMMLSPVAISLPFKLIFFVLIDGWALVAGSLVRGFSL